VAGVAVLAMLLGLLARLSLIGGVVTRWIWSRRR